jgi:uncharacterized protein YkwD
MNLKQDEQLKIWQLAKKLLQGIVIAITILCVALPQARAQAAGADEPYLSALEKEIVAELNQARTNPALYAGMLEATRKYYEGKVYKEPGRIMLLTQEGVKAVDEAIAFLRKQQPNGTLAPSKGLTLAARDHVKGTGPSGLIGHTGRDGSKMTERISRYGEWLGSCSENISYGEATARGIVLQLIVDDGIAGRGHRTNIFNPASTRVGVAAGPHNKYKVMCVMDFANGYNEKQ